MSETTRAPNAIHIQAPHFTAAVVLARTTVVRAPPILRYMIGWHAEQVLKYAKEKGWKAAWL
jgi:hypothetical protein